VNGKKQFGLRISMKWGIVRFAENAVEILKILRRRMMLKEALEIVKIWIR